LIVYYLDASAWVKRYYQELGSAWVQNMFAHHRLIASASLGVIEVTATLARKAKGREIDPSMLDNKLRELDEDWTVYPGPYDYGCGGYGEAGSAGVGPSRR
jgi:predicted nucleic acid-binding protein